MYYPGALDPTKLEAGPCNMYWGTRLMGYLAEGFVLKVATRVTPLHGAQAGDAKLDAIVQGGDVTIECGLLEQTLTNYAAGIVNSVLVEGGGKSRLDFMNRVGLSLRSLAQELVIVKLKGGVESDDPADIFVFAEVSPAEGEVDFTFHPTQQREIKMKFEAWQNAETNRWGFVGDEDAVAA